MKLIIFQREPCTASIKGYRNSVKMAYLINSKVALAGLSEQEYLLPDILGAYSCERKVELMLTYELGDEIHGKIAGYRDLLNELIKKKNRSRQELVVMETLKKGIGKLFASFGLGIYNFDLFGLKTMKELLDKDYFYFYHLKAGDAVNESAPITDTTTLLLLELPDPEKGIPLLFLNLGTEGSELLGIDLVEPQSKWAEDKTCFYGLDSFVFPSVEKLTTNEIRQGRLHLERVTAEFRQKIEEWAGVCYANPNSNVGLEHFRKNLDGFLPGLKNRVQESLILKNAANVSRGMEQGKIIVGEAPIQRIWELYRDSGTITTMEYFSLIKIKKQQYPKYEGRWPVLFFAGGVDVAPENGNVGQVEEMVGVRRRISVE